MDGLDLIVAIEDLYLDDRDYERTYVTGVVKGMLNRINLPLLKQSQLSLLCIFLLHIRSF